MGKFHYAKGNTTQTRITAPPQTHNATQPHRGKTMAKRAPTLLTDHCRGDFEMRDHRRQNPQAKPTTIGTEPGARMSEPASEIDSRRPVDRLVALQ